MSTFRIGENDSEIIDHDGAIGMRVALDAIIARAPTQKPVLDEDLSEMEDGGDYDVLSEHHEAVGRWDAAEIARAGLADSVADLPRDAVWKLPSVDKIVTEMCAVATGEYEGHGDTCDPWTADNRAAIDLWQAGIRASIGRPDPVRDAAPDMLAMLKAIRDEQPPTDWRYDRWRHGGWYVGAVHYPEGAVGCVSNNYADKRWRIACDPRPDDEQPSFKTRDEAALAEWLLVQRLRVAAVIAKAEGRTNG